MNSIDVSGLPMWYADQGSGTPLLLVHGFPLDHRMWQAQFEELAGCCRVIAPDLRGFGRTPLDHNSNDELTTTGMRQFADDLAGLLDALAVREPVVFCGLSMGGYIGWQFALAHRGRLRGLVLCDTRAVADTAEGAAARLDLADRVLRSGSELVAEAMVLKLVSDGTSRQRPELVQRLREMISENPPQGIAAALRGMAIRPDVRDQLARIDVPALLVCGAADTISPPEEMRGIAEALPQAEFVEIPQAGHLAPLEQPAEVNRAIREFLARL